MIELQADELDGSVWFMIHCGSRGYGYQTAEYYFYKSAELRNLASNRRGLSWLMDDEALGKEYLDHHNSAANYAIVNRFMIAESIRQATQKVFKADCEMFYDINHNLVQKEQVMVDGKSKFGYVHRKGATRAMPTGHPDLVGTTWYNKGNPALIPGSMFLGCAILTPTVNSFKSGFSVNHGSGRLMARGAAKRLLKNNQQDIDDQMNNIVRTLGGVEVRGIITNTNHIPLDECGDCYKDLDVVLDVLVKNDIVVINRRLFPVANIKGD
jgi:tRNA-splicing ligase RtcB